MSTYQTGFATSEKAEAAFYAAFRACDQITMAQVWGPGEVVCIHPGSGAIVGHDMVLRSWSHIFTNSILPDIQVTMVRQFLNDSVAIHVVEEHIATGGSSYASVLATNIYQKYDEGWLMVEHHGSVIQVQTQAHMVQ